MPGTQGKNNKSTRARLRVTSHFFCIVFLLIIFLLIIVVIVLILLLFIIRLLGVVFLLLFCLLNLAQSFPLLREGVRLSNIISDNDIVENRATFHLPEIKADKAEVGILINGII